MKQQSDIRFEPVTGSEQQLAALQRVFRSAPDYVRLTSGAGPTGEEALTLWRELPSGVSRADKRVFLLYEGADIVGCADLLRDYPGPGTDFLGLLLLSESARGRGLGSQAYASLEGTMRARGTSRVRLGVLAANSGAVAFWRSMGFEATGERSSYRRGVLRLEVLLFEKTIADVLPLEARRRRRRIRFVSDGLVREIIGGVKTASVTRLGEVDLIEDEFDDVLLVGEEYDVFDSNGARRATIRVLAMELCTWGDLPERLWRGEGDSSADEFRRNHRSYFDDPGSDTELVAYYFERVPSGDRSRDIVVREYERSDWEAVCGVHDRARPVELESLGDAVSFRPMAEVAESDRFFDGETHVAKVDGEVVGFVTVNDDEITWLYVEPRLVGRGIGRTLVEHVIGDVGPDAHLLCGAGNARARRFYESCGFTVAAVFPGSAEGLPCECLRMCLPWSRHRGRPPRPGRDALELAGYPESGPGRPVRGPDGIWRWAADDGDPRGGVDE